MEARGEALAKTQMALLTGLKLPNEKKPFLEAAPTAALSNANVSLWLMASNV